MAKRKNSGSVVVVAQSRRPSIPDFGPTGRLAAVEIGRFGDMLKREQAARASSSDAWRFEPPSSVRDATVINREEPEKWWRWRALPGGHPLIIAWKQGKIDASEFNAGNLYRVMYERANDPKGRDCTQGMVISRSTNGGGLPSRGDIEAERALKRIHKRLSRIDGIIVEAFCGRALKAPQAVLGAVNCDPRSVWSRLKEALGELTRATEREPRPDGAPELAA